MRRLIILLIGVVAGVLVQRSGLVRELLRAARIRPYGRVVDFAPTVDSGLNVRDWRAGLGPRPLVLLVIGQSHAANFGESGNNSDSAWILLNGRVHRSGEPLAGAEGRGGSIWPRVASAVARRESTSVLIIPAAIGGTTIKEWEPRAAPGRLLMAQVLGAVRSGLTVDAVLLMQGEADAASETPANAWQSSFRRIADALQRAGVAAPILVATESRCFGTAISAPIVSAQKSVISAKRVFAGPDLDELGPGFRWDGCHLTRGGLDTVAAGWVAALSRTGVLPVSRR